MTVPAGFPVKDGPLIPSWPRILFQVAWNAGGNSTSPNHWYTVSKRLRGSWKASLSGRQYELDAVQAGTMSFTLDNLDGAFDPDNTASFYSPYVLPYRRVRLVAMTGPSQNQLFPWVANGTSTQSLATSVGTLGTATGLSASTSGLTTAQTWTLPNGTGGGRSFGATGVTKSWSSFDSDGVTVTPGAPYSAGLDVQLAPGGMSSLTMQPKVLWYDPVGNLISTSFGGTLTATTTWQRITFHISAAPAGAAFGLLAIANTVAITADTTVRTTAWQFEQTDVTTPYANPGTWSPLWQGFVERWSQRYDHDGKYGLVDVTCVDALAPLSQLQLNGNAMPAWLKSSGSGAQYVFPLDETGLPGYLHDDMGTAATLKLTPAWWFTAFGTSQLFVGSPITAVSTTGVLTNTNTTVFSFANNQDSTQGTSADARYLVAANGSATILPTSGAWSRLICFKTSLTPGAGGTYTTSTLWATTADDVSQASCYINSSGKVVASITDNGGTNYTTTSAATVTDGNWHAALVSFGATQIRLSLDGVETASTVGEVMLFGYAYDAVAAKTGTGGTVTTPFRGDLAYFAQWASVLTPVMRQSITAGFTKGWSGDSVAQRVQVTLDASGFHPGSGSTFAAVGTSGTLGSTDVSTRSPLDVIQSAADTENGQFAIDRNGTPTLYGHVWRWIQSLPRVTFGELSGSGEVPYEGDVAFEQDPSHLYNDVQITVDGAVDANGSNALQESTDATSQAAYFPQTLSRSVNAYQVQTGKDIADYLLSQYKDPHTRIDGITVDLASDTSRMPALATLAFADLVRVKRRPALAPAKSLDGFIESIEWSGDDTGSKLEFAAQISPVSQYRYWMISATWAALSAGIASGVSTVTVGPLCGSSAVPASAVLPTPYDMVIGYGTANAETVTVTGVGSTSAGYSSVALTLAFPTTKAHSASDFICSPLPSGTTLPPSPAYPASFDNASALGNTLIGF